MTATTIATVMDEIGVALATVSGLRVFDFPPESASPPFAFCDMPDSIDYDLTFGRGVDRFTIPVYVGVGTQSDRTARDLLCVYAAGDSIKAAIEALSVGDVSYRVVSAKFTHIALADGTYPGVVFSVDIAA